MVFKSRARYTYSSLTSTSKCGFGIAPFLAVSYFRVLIAPWPSYYMYYMYYDSQGCRNLWITKSGVHLLYNSTKRSEERLRNINKRFRICVEGDMDAGKSKKINTCTWSISNLTQVNCTSSLNSHKPPKPCRGRSGCKENTQTAASQNWETAKAMKATKATTAASGQIARWNLNKTIILSSRVPSQPRTNFSRYNVQICLQRDTKSDRSD